MENNKPVFYRYSSLDKELINVDYQIHTKWTDGINTVEEIIKAAEKIGLKEIAFTEHIRKDSVYFLDYYKEISNIRKKSDIKVYIGVEAKVIDKSGNIDLSESNYTIAEIVLGSVHRVNVNGDYYDLKLFDKEMAFKLEHEYTQALISGGKIDVLAHPGGMSYKYFGEIPEFFIEETIKSISQFHIAFEINSKYINEKILDKILYYCKIYDPYVSIGSDAHQVSDLGNCRTILGEYI